MILEVYKGIYGAPAKCGSRFFRKTISEWGDPEVRSFREFYTQAIKLESIIIRNPLEHLKSALQTEVMDSIINGLESKETILKIMKSYTDINNGGAHFHPYFCKLIYQIWCKPGKKLKIVDLSNLSEYMKEILYEIPYDETEYDFHWNKPYLSKDDVWNKCMDLYPDLLNELVEYATNDIKYYNGLLNGDRSLIKMI